MPRTDHQPGLYVCTTSRSGSSMVSGLFAAHGVFFGHCFGPRPTNRKGNFENRWLKRILKTRNVPDPWPEAWFQQLRREGWDGEMPWGAKTGPNSWPIIQPMRPTVIVMCWRPTREILDSRRRARHFADMGERGIRNFHDHMRRIAAAATVPVVHVDTPALVAGDHEQIIPALDVLGLEFDAAVADDWIDPHLFNMGKT